MAPAGVIDQEQLDAKLTRLIGDHNHYRTLLFRYIRRSLALCIWYMDQDCPSFFRQFERTEKLAGLVYYIRDHALQSFQVVDRSGSALLSQVDILLARASNPLLGSPAQAMSPTSTKDGSVNSRLLFLAGEIKEAIRFWREQCFCAQYLEPKVFEMDRIAELRNLALTSEGSTLEEKARGLRISAEQSKLVTEGIEPFLDQWLGRLSVVERPTEAPGHVWSGGGAGGA